MPGATTAVSPPSVASGDPALALRAIVKRRADRPVLNGVDLVLEPGRLVRIKGANGAGKTTLLRIAAGLVRPDEGSVSLLGLDPERDRAGFMTRLGYVSAGDRGLYPRLSARRHLAFAVAVAQLSPRRHEDAIESALRAFELTAFAERRVERLSTGQRQRVRLALAFVHDPEVVLLDEPASSLDDDGIRILADALDALRRRGGAALWCAPSTVDPQLPFDRRFVLQAGALLPE
jgi:ABC-2 type transport system ATP-binding protein